LTEGACGIAGDAHFAILAVGAPDQPLALSLQRLPHSLRSELALSGAKGPHWCGFLFFQPLRQQDLEPRLIGNITLVRQHFEPGDARFGQAQ